MRLLFHSFICAAIVVQALIQPTVAFAAITDPAANTTWTAGTSPAEVKFSFTPSTCSYYQVYVYNTSVTPASQIYYSSQGPASSPETFNMGTVPYAGPAGPYPAQIKVVVGDSFGNLTTFTQNITIKN